MIVIVNLNAGALLACAVADASASLSSIFKTMLFVSLVSTFLLTLIVLSSLYLGSTESVFNRVCGCVAKGSDSEEE